MRDALLLVDVITDFGHEDKGPEATSSRAAAGALARST